MIEFKIDGEKYTIEQYEKDTIRLLDSIRTQKPLDGKHTCYGVDCSKCPFDQRGCTYSVRTIEAYLNRLEIAYHWAKEHPETK